MALLYALSFIATAFGAMEQGLINFYVNDTIDYLQMMEGKTLNGMVSAVNAAPAGPAEKGYRFPFRQERGVIPNVFLNRF